MEYSLINLNNPLSLPTYNNSDSIEYNQIISIFIHTQFSSLFTDKAVFNHLSVAGFSKCGV